MGREKSALVVKIIFGHLVPEILQSWASVGLFLYRLYVVDLAFVSGTDERR